MEKFKFISIFFLFVLNSCSSSQLSQTNHIFILEGSEYLIFDVAVENFTPTINEVTLTDSIVINYLKKNSPFINKYIMIDNYNDLYRQYLGTIDSADRKIIFVNTFCDEDDTLRANKDLILGFGECYFQLLVSLNEKLCIKPTKRNFTKS
jgi:hypothetical protein